MLIPELFKEIETLEDFKSFCEELGGQWYHPTKEYETRYGGTVTEELEDTVFCKIPTYIPHFGSNRFSRIYVEKDKIELIYPGIKFLELEIPNLGGVDVGIEPFTKSESNINDVYIRTQPPAHHIEGHLEIDTITVQQDSDGQLLVKIGLK